MKTDLPQEYLYFTTAIIPFTKKESVFLELRKGRLENYGRGIKNKLRY
jgi:hypothetical protein